MFNDSSTHSERQQVLQSIMQKGSDAIGNDVHTDTQINKLLARSEEEYQLFQEVSPAPVRLAPACPWRPDNVGAGLTEAASLEPCCGWNQPLLDPVLVLQMDEQRWPPGAEQRPRLIEEHELPAWVFAASTANVVSPCTMLCMLPHMPKAARGAWAKLFPQNRSR